MASATRTTIVNVGYRSTNCWVISAGQSRMLFDLGWPGSMGMMLANLKRMDVPLEEIRCALASHYHIDHGGLAQEFKEAGVALLVLDVQVEAIPRMKTWIKEQDNYLEVVMEDIISITAYQSRQLLADIGIAGQILHTPGHSDDSVSLLLDDGKAFTGDLTHPNFIGMEDEATVIESWRLLKSQGANLLYPGHGQPYPINDFDGVI